MWVRSQNKKFLGDYDSFAVSESGIVLGFQGPEDGEGAVLGAYENEEKALNVLDELQTYIGLSESTSHQGVQTINKAIFEMPIGINKEVAKLETGYEIIYLGNGQVGFIRVFDEIEEE